MAKFTNDCIGSNKEMFVHTTGRLNILLCSLEGIRRIKLRGFLPLDLAKLTQNCGKNFMMYSYKNLSCGPVTKSVERVGQGLEGPTIASQPVS